MSRVPPVLLVCDCVSWRLDLFEDALDRVFALAEQRSDTVEICVGYRARDDLALVSIAAGGAGAGDLRGSLLFEARLPGLHVLDLPGDGPSVEQVEARGLASCDVIVRTAAAREVTAAIKLRLGTSGDPRAAVRLRLAVPLRFETPGGWVDASTSDLNAGGAFVRTAHRPDLGELVDLRFFPESKAPVLATATIVRHGADGFGARIELAPAAQNDLYRRIRALRAPVPAAFRPEAPAPVTGLEPDARDVPVRSGPRANLDADIAEVLQRPRARALLAVTSAETRRAFVPELSRAGFDVLIAESVREAFDRLLEELLALDLLVVDGDIPGPQVGELLHRIRAIGGETDLPIAILNGSERLDAESLTGAGVRLVGLRPEVAIPELRAMVDARRTNALS